MKRIIEPLVLSPRDRRIVAAVARFGQLSSRHIQLLIFDGGNRTPADRALRRLVDAGFLIRLERRIVGGARGGSGQYVYSLGRRGHYMLREGDFQVDRNVRFHTMCIVDAFCVIKRLVSERKFELFHYSTEPDCWVTIGRQELRPDLFVEIGRGERRLKLWLEIDMGTESQRRIKEKIDRYQRAYNDADVAEWPEFPRVLFVTLDYERADELKWIISRAPSPRALFDVTVLEDLDRKLAGD